MFGLDPLSRPVAIVEIVILLTLAALTGWLISRFILNGRIKGLRAEIADKEANLAECRRAKAPSATTAVTTPLPSSTPTPAKNSSNSQESTVSPTVTFSSQTVVAEPTTTRITESGPLPALPTPSPSGSSEASILSRIASRAAELNFDRIGRATADNADNLQEINGVGPFLERKLHSLGIFTFRQIANFTKEDSAKVNEIIEFFPGRIDRDGWVGQAKAFFEKKYGTDA